MIRGGDAAPIDVALGQATTLMQRGDLRSAATVVQQVLAQRPDHPRALQLAGGLALQGGNTGTAIQLLSRAATLDPNNPHTLSNLGLALTRVGQRDEAVRHLRQALTLQPNLAAAQINLAVALTELGRVAEAEAAARKAVMLQPKSADAHQALGLALEAGGHFEGAVAAHRKAVALAPQRGEMQGELASTLTAFGDLEGAQAALAEAIRLEPQQGKWRQRLTRLRQSAGDAGEFRTLLAATSAPSQRAPLLFGLAQALDDAGLYEAAMDAYVEANTLRRAQLSYSVAETEALFADIVAAFNPDLFESLVGSGNREEGPIFILGMPRSGTSLVEQILASHPEVHGGGELLLLRSLVAALGPPGATTHNTEVVRSLTKARLAQLGTDYLKRLRPLGGHKPMITDKMPGNYLLIGYIALALPGARIIHVRRDPLDNCLSIFKSDFGSPIAYAYDQSELGNYYNHYRALMAHWHEVLPGRIYDLDYEALVGAQEAETRRLLAHCGLEWSDACRNFQHTKRPVRTVSAAQVREPIHNRSIGAAARYGNKLAPLINALEGR